MPEYLAPGVYVEETSFRSKSIEGVSTSTTAFVGPTRRGPYYDPDNPSPDATPELLTSFADFERIYGGLADLAIGPNYLAHGVKAYFDNGGSRLYVSRVFMHNASDGRALSAPVVPRPDEVDDKEATKFLARTPGSAGNGTITLRQVETPVTVRGTEAAPSGSMLRTGGAGTAAQPARLEGGMPPFRFLDSGRLLLKVGGANAEIELHGEPAEVTGTSIESAGAIALTDDNRELKVTVDGLPEQTISLTKGERSIDQIVDEINDQLRSGHAHVTDGNTITIVSDRRGKHAEVSVKPNATLGFETGASATGADNAANNVGDLLAVTADEINALLVKAGAEARAALTPTTGRIVLTSTEAGEDAEIVIREGGAGENEVAKILGFAPKQRAQGEKGAQVTYYVKSGTTWFDAGGKSLPPTDFKADGTHKYGADLLTLTLTATDRDDNQIAYEGLGFDRDHPRWVGHVLAVRPTRRSEALESLFAVDVGSGVTAFELRDSLFATGAERSVTLIGGNDGVEPNAQAYANALKALEQIEDISIVAAPGSSALAEAQGIMNELIIHVERGARYRIAVLDTPPGQSVSQARMTRSRIDSTRAAMYYPWVVVPNPLSRPGNETIPREITLPPSGFICGIYARNDVERGVFKAPANEVVRGALRFETDINFAQQEVLNPLGVNCLRFFPGRGYRVWGARTASSDPEWKYVNVRRYFNYLERSIDVGTQWAVFEPNGERLWANIRDTLESFLYNEWTIGALLGASPKEAFFVRCDRTTMTQNDLDNGRLVCLVGVAAVKPAEFVIFRIGQKTADARA